MNNDRLSSYAIFKLFLMSLSLTVPLIMIGASGLVILIVTILVFASALCGNVGIAYIFRALYNILLRPGLYIWAFIDAISNQQDFISVCFYVVFALQIINIITNLIGEIIMLISLMDN